MENREYGLGVFTYNIYLTFIGVELLSPLRYALLQKAATSSRVYLTEFCCKMS
jgi:hypothetical protein